MTNKIRSDFNNELAGSLLNEIQYQLSNYYYCLGKIDKWDNLDSVPSIPPIDSYYENSSVKEDIIFIKKITYNDVSIVIPRYGWTSGEQYDFWDDKNDMRGSKFYCVNSNLNVYKCLDNNGGVPSSVMPTETSLEAFKTLDGYTWKYMYNIPMFKRNKFNSLEYIPVQRALSDSFYNKGSIERVDVIDGGSGYNSNMLTYLNVVGAIPYQGSGANLVPIISLFNVYAENGIDIIRPKGSIIGVKIVYGGTGYSLPPIITIVDTLNAGRGLWGTHARFTSVVNSAGTIINVVVVDPGIDYSSYTDTTITVQGDGAGAKFTPVVYGGSIVDVVVENVGSGYTYINLSVQGAGNGAKVNPIFGVSDFISDQSVIEQSAVPGAIYSIKVENGGSNYSQNTTISVEGDWEENGGTKCIVTPIIINGVITKIVISVFGSKYNYIDLRINDTLGSGAILRVINTPIGGHGVDAVSELFGNTIAINSSVRDNKTINKLSHNYRQFGIIKNPTNKLTGKKFRDDSSLMTYDIVFNSVEGLLESGNEDILVFGDTEFKVVYVNNNIVTLLQVGTKYINNLVGIFKLKDTNRIYTSNQVLSYPTVDKYSGKLLYVSDENPFSLTADQGIVIKTFLKF